MKEKENMEKKRVIQVRDMGFSVSKKNEMVINMLNNQKVGRRDKYDQKSVKGGKKEKD
ncbi:hypothetical protein [Cytobacillus oceanisediminis]|uniref:hypothetical protein n=1 Tax=Cytobacillus oceanisediminis TaxID=665099 RepID=UPI001FB4C523|nr:hypothetical protein [Cytobacillus oceanisediminis]UOE58028.1 hypothetical protein IRB79_27580 [Cytobacillus oceanisediminis]